jgi:enoyl-CoA hydratase
MAVRVDRRGAVTVITIDRVDKRNAIDAATTQALDAAFNEFSDDDGSRVAVLTGGQQVFCAGTDIARWGWWTN